MRLCICLITEHDVTIGVHAERWNILLKVDMHPCLCLITVHSATIGVHAKRRNVMLKVKRHLHMEQQPEMQCTQKYSELNPEICSTSWQMQGCVARHVKHPSCAGRTTNSECNAAGSSGDQQRRSIKHVVNAGIGRTANFECNALGISREQQTRLIKHAI